MHNLATVRIRNFRACADVAVRLAPFTPLVGQNNCGKSTIIAAIGWLLRPYVLDASHFGNAGSPLSVSGEISGLTGGHLDLLTAEHRDRIAPFCAGGRLTIRRTQATPGGGAKNVVLEVRDPGVAGDDEPAAWRKNPTGIDAAIQALFPAPIHIRAMEDAAADVTSGKKDSTIGRLIASLIENLTRAHGADLTEALKGIQRKLSATGEDRAAELNAVDEGANASLADLFPGLRVRVHFQPPSIADLFKAGTIKVYEGEAESERDVDDLGHGAQRAIQMALVRYLAAASRDADAATCTLLLVDEPELYLHPHAIEQIRIALTNLASSGFQIVFSTHSPMLIAVDNIEATVMVHRPSGGATAVRSRIADAWAEAVEEAPSQIRRLFEFGNASRILFASRVVIAEGETEQRLLPLIYETLRKQSLMASGIGLIATGGGGGVKKCMALLRGLGIPCLAIVDLDYAFRQAVKSTLITADDPAVKSARLLMDEMKDVHGFVLDADGFPKRSGHYSASEAFALFAKDPRATAPIAAIATRLRASGYWLWERGTIEEHLGIVGKGEDAWAEYTTKLREDPLDDVVQDFVGVSNLIAWIEGKESALEHVD